MKPFKRIYEIMGSMSIVMLLLGCGAPAISSPLTNTTTPNLPSSSSTPVLATETHPAEPLTSTTTQAFTLATSSGEIVGTWQAGSYYIRFYIDGTFHQSHALDKLDGQPYSISSYQFEGTKMVITEISVSGVPSCGKKVGNFEIQLLESGSIQIVTITDQCASRGNDIAKEYEPVR